MNEVVCISEFISIVFIVQLVSWMSWLRQWWTRQNVSVLLMFAHSQPHLDIV